MPRWYERATDAERRRLAVAAPRSRYRYSRRRWRWLFGAVDAVGGTVAALLRLVPRRRRRDASWDEPRAILLVQLDHFGDALITRAMLPDLRARFPQARLEVLSGPWNREVFEACAEIDRVHVSQLNRFARNRRAFWWLATLAWGVYLRRFRFDWAIDVRGEFPLALLLWLCGAKRRIGWNCGGGGFLLTDSPPFAARRRELDARRSLLATLGIALSPQSSTPPYAVGAYSRQIADRWLAAEGPASGPRIALHIGAGTQAKQWPETHWQELMGRLIVEKGARIALLGTADDRARMLRITGSREWPGVVDFVGRTRVDELAAVIARADVFVGADSGPAHLAAAVGTSAVVLFSGTNDATQWRPVGRRVKVLTEPVLCSPCHRTTCAWADHPCMGQLAPATVLQAIDEFLTTQAVEGPQPSPATSRFELGALTETLP